MLAHYVGPFAAHVGSLNNMLGVEKCWLTFERSYLALFHDFERFYLNWFMYFVSDNFLSFANILRRNES